MICGKSSALPKLAVNSWVPQSLMVTSDSAQLLPVNPFNSHSIHVSSAPLLDFKIRILWFIGILRGHVVNNINCTLEGEKCKTKEKAAKEIKPSQIIKDSRAYPVSLSLGWASLEKCLSILCHLNFQLLFRQSHLFNLSFRIHLSFSQQYKSHI